MSRFFTRQKRLGADSPTEGNAQKMFEILVQKVSHEFHEFTQIIIIPKHLESGDIMLTVRKISEIRKIRDKKTFHYAYINRLMI